MTEEKNAYVEARPTQFLPKLKGEKVVIRLASGGQPATGIIESYNPYESLHHDRILWINWPTMLENWSQAI